MAYPTPKLNVVVPYSLATALLTPQRATCKVPAHPLTAIMYGVCLHPNCSPRLHYPQEASNFSKNPKDTKAVVQKCDASLNLGNKSSNCFSWNCVKGADGIAVCSCPTGQVAAATTFLAEAGQGNPAACSQYPVSLPIQAQDSPKKK